MSIELHCPGCSKLIRAPKDAGGKTGKCPYCSRKVYIPMPPEDIEPIPLAPMDPEDAEREAQMRRESSNYAAIIDHGGEGSSSESGASTVIDVGSEVRNFVTAMHTSNLDEADRIVAKLQRAGSKSKDAVEGIMLDEMPLQVSSVPPALVKGFLKALLARLNG